MGMGEINKKVLLFCADYNGSPISVFDTTEMKFLGELPDSAKLTAEDSDKILDTQVIVRNNLAIVTDFCK